MADSYLLGQRSPALGPNVGFGLLVIVAVVVAVLWLVPPPLFLPTFSLVGLGLAAGAAMMALGRRTPHRSQGVDWWDIAGACAFIGSAAGMISEPEVVLHFFGGSAAE